MSRFICIVFFLTFFSVCAFSQRIYFIYIQSEAEQPFFVRLGEKAYNSTPAGYLVLSQLKDSSYNFKVGFPQSKWPDQQFKVDIKSKDRGYLLKNFGDKGWGLFDLQSLSVQMAAENAKAEKKQYREVSAFTEVLSRAANDPSLKEKPVFAVVRSEPVNEVGRNEPAKEKASTAVVKEEVKKEEANISLPANDSKAVVVANDKKVDTAANRTQPDNAVAAVARDDVKKDQVQPPVPAVNESKPEALSKENPSGLNGGTTKPDTTVAAVVKAKADSNLPGTVKKQDIQTEKTETVQTKLQTPNEEAKVEKSTASVPVNEEPRSAPTAYYKKSIVTKKSERSTTEGFGLTFIDQESNGEKDTIQIFIANSPAPVVNRNQQQIDEKKFLNITDEERDGRPVGSKAVAKNNCVSTASQDDFLKLRRKMAGQKTEEAMLEEAKKAFKLKCYETEQIKNLGSLFLNEAAKFQFYEAAYPYSVDRGNFAVLQAELKDNYFIHRFKNLLKDTNL